MKKLISCDIFCAVVDNFGDIGVCWRLAKQLAHEHSMAVRLWVDDLSSFHKLHAAISPLPSVQYCSGIEIRRWDSSIFESEHQKVAPAQLVIEGFACDLPESYILAMARQERQSVWINLEHLSAEEWVDGCHCLPSPHPSLPLVKHFFFPGFTSKTGGLLVERGLIERRDTFQADSHAQAKFWQALDVPLPSQNEVRVSLLCYGNMMLPSLFLSWAKSDIPILCFVSEGCALSEVADFFGRNIVAVGDVLQHGNLEVRVLPFIEQERYDELLWICDINFVRGEDSCVRAQLAGRPFVWQIYPQQDNAHIKKLSAFMVLYRAGLPPSTMQALCSLWDGWNLENHEELVTSTDLAQRWNECWAHKETLQRHAHAWSSYLSENNLALNLLNFFQKIDRMHDLKA